MKSQNLRPALKIICFVLFVAFVGCQSKSPKVSELKEPETQVETNPFFTINFAEIIKHKREVPISEIAESVEFVPFENTGKSLLGNVFDVQLTPEYIFLKHSGSRLLTQFSRNGKFIRHIGTEGRGPKEYGLMRKFSIDEKNRLIYIHTNWTRKILVYNFDGEYVKTLKFENIGRGYFTWSRDSFLVSFSEPNIGNEPYIFIETNFNGDTLQTTNNHIFWDEKEKSNFMVSYWGRNEFYRAGNKLHMKGWYNDTVYSYNDENKIVPKFFIDLKEHKIPDDQVFERQSTKPMPDECYWVGVNESSDYIFIRYGLQYNKKDKNLHERADGCVIYNKESKEGIALKENDGACGFINDLNAGPYFKPGYSNDSLIFVEVSALDMKLYLDSDKFKNKTVKFPEQKEKLVQLNKTLKEDENPFLMIAKLKE